MKKYQDENFDTLKKFNKLEKLELPFPEKNPETLVFDENNSLNKIVNILKNLKDIKLKMEIFL